jgi:RHS repeat-associated protein
LPTLTTDRGLFPGDSFDANGNQVTADGVTLSYDFRDKLKSTSGGVTAIGYDGDGQRTSKTINGVTTHYLVDELNPTGYAQVVEELVNGQVQRVYTYGQALLSQRQLIAGSWVTSHYGYDGSGNVRVLTNGAGAVTDTFDYDAYGNLLGRTGTTPNSYLYRGQQFDADLGVYYLRARYYSPQRGRFLTRDTFDGVQSEPRSLHKYLYAQADPINQLDASGFASTAEFSLGANRLIAQTEVALFALSWAILCQINAVSSVLERGGADAVVGCQAIRTRDRERDKDRVIPRVIPKPRETGDEEVLYHYTSQTAAVGIQQSQFIIATSTYRGRTYTFPSGAYASDIEPTDTQFTQRQLSALFYGGNENKDVSWYVKIKKNDFIPIRYPGIEHFFYRPARAGDYVPVDVEEIGLNLMSP